MDDRLTGDALWLRLEHCAGCGECGRPLRASEAREFLLGHPDTEERRLRRRYFDDEDRDD